MGSSGVLVVVSESCGRDTLRDTQCPTAHSRFVIRPVQTRTGHATHTARPAPKRSRGGRPAQPAGAGTAGRDGESKTQSDVRRQKKVPTQVKSDESLSYNEPATSCRICLELSIHRLVLHLQFTLNLAHCPHTGGARVNRYLKSHRWHAYRCTALAAHARHIQTSSAGGHARIFFDAPLLPLQPTTSHAS